LLIDPALVLYLSRHGETVFNRENRFCGQAASPLTAKGIAEAHRNGQALRRSIGGRDELRLISSPLERALRTAEIIRDELGHRERPIETDARLREISFGAWEGLTLDEIKSRDPLEWERRIDDRWHHAPPGGESYAEVVARAGAWLAEAHGSMLVVTHGAVDRVLRGVYAGLSPDEICKLPEPQDQLFQLKGGRITTL